MQSVSELWKTLRQTPGTEVEYRFTINGTVYGSDAEVSHSVKQKLYEDFSFGNAECAMLKLEIYADDIPKGATIFRECRLVNGSQASEWIPKGIFYTSTRKEEDGLWNITAYDIMRKGEAVWHVDQTDTFPMTMNVAVDRLMAAIDPDLELDERSVISTAYQVDYPSSDQTIRQTLQYIAAAHLGNFIITDAGKLRLVPLLSLTAETAYLANENGDAILFGGEAILV